MLKGKENLTAAFDGYTAVDNRSLYALVITTPERKVVIGALQDLSLEQHTGETLAGMCL
jgi:hypothetical protein